MKQYTNEEWFLLVLIFGVLVISLLIFKPFIIPLILAVVFATTFSPLHKKILKWTGGRKGLASLISTLSILVLAIAPIAFLITQIFKEATELFVFLTGPEGSVVLTDTIQGLVVSSRDFVPGADNFTFNIDEYTSSGLNWFLSHLSSFLTNILGLLMSLFIFLISLYYLFKDGDKIQRMVISLSPLHDSYDHDILNKLELAVNSVIKGSLAIAIIQGILTAIGFLIFGVPNPALWGGVAAIAALIPGFGTALVIGPAVLYLLIVGKSAAGIGLLIWGVVAVGLIDNFLGPKLVERGIRIHPFLILLSILGGLALFGPMGFLLGPLVLSLLLALLDIYSSVRNKAKQTV